MPGAILILTPFPGLSHDFEMQETLRDQFLDADPDTPSRSKSGQALESSGTCAKGPSMTVPNKVPATKATHSTGPTRIRVAAGCRFGPPTTNSPFR